MNNRLNRYFTHMGEEYVFIELTPDYMKRIRIDFMRGVPLPVKRVYVENLSDNQGVEFSLFTMGMISIIGIDPEFEYASRYVKLLTHMNNDIANVAVNVGVGLAHTGRLEQAAVNFRAAQVIDPENTDALYNYMLVCRDLYRKSEDKQYVTDFKEEVFECLIRLREIKPDMAMACYYLGYAYINMGRYFMAQQEWKEFLRLARSGPEIEEIKSRMADLENAVEIESGYRDIMDGRWQKGVSVLEAYLDTPYRAWWPLLYYLGVGYNRLGRYEEALIILKKAAAENPSSPEIAAELVITNEALNDEINAEKYRRKLAILNTPIEEK